MQNRNKFDILDEIAHYKKILNDLETELEAKISVEVSEEPAVQPITKHLKIKFWKAERALAMQIVEQEGLPKHKEDGFVKILGKPEFFIDSIYLRGCNSPCDLKIDHLIFENNKKRNNYIYKITKAITDELFTNEQGGDLKVGDVCEVSESGKCWVKKLFVGKVDKSFGTISPFMTINSPNDQYITRWEYARPIAKRIEPKIEVNGEVVTYTWKE